MHWKCTNKIEQGWFKFLCIIIVPLAAPPTQFKLRRLFCFWPFSLLLSLPVMYDDHRIITLNLKINIYIAEFLIHHFFNEYIDDSWVTGNNGSNSYTQSSWLWLTLKQLTDKIYSNVVYMNLLLLNDSDFKF